MAKVFKQKARADIYRDGLRTSSEKNKSGYSHDRSKPAGENDVVIVKKGDSYYTWTLYGRAPQISMTPPTRQQLTGSDFLCHVYDLEDRLSSLSPISVDDLISERDSIVDDINNLRDETQEKRDSMPEQLQEVGSGEMLGNRVESLEEWASNLGNVDISFEEDEDDKEDKGDDADPLQDYLDEVTSELQSYNYEGE